MRYDTTPPRLVDGRGLRVAIVVSRFHDEVTRELQAGAERVLRAAGVDGGDIEVFDVPGAFEIPLAARTAARSGRFAALVCLGCIIKGETPHFEYIASAVAQGLTEAMGATGVPMAFGVLTTNSLDEARARAGDGPSNKGWEAAAAALEMARVLQQIAANPAPTGAP